MRTQAFVVADDPVYLSWLQNAASGAEFSLMRPHDADDLLERVHNAGRVDVVFFQFTAETASLRATMVERLLERHPDIAVAGIGESDDPALMLSAMRSGARDFFILKRDEANVAALLSRLLRRATPVTAAGRKQGKVFAIVAAHPYDGIAFLGEHLTLACAERTGKAERTLLLDLATPAGAGAVFLNINQTYGVLDAVNDVSRADPTLVDSAFPKHGSGIHVLSLPEDSVGQPNIDADEMLKLVGVLRSVFGCIVVTLDGHLPMALLRGTIALADRTLLVTDQSILKSRHSKYLLRALRLEDAPLEHTGLVVDNYRRRVGLEPENLAELLDLPIAATLSTTAANRIQSMNQGEPLFTCAPKDEYCAGVRALAASLLGVEAARPAPAGPGGLLGRLFN